MFKQMVESLEKANVLAKLKKGELVCPKCGVAAGDLPESWDTLMICPSCGTRNSLSEWASVSDTEKKVWMSDQPPVGTKIRREVLGSGTVIWNIPAVGKFGFFLVFAVLWLLITGTVSGGFLFAFLTGGKIEGNMPQWAMIPFFGLFWAVGLGMLYAAFRQKYMSHTVTFSSDKITLRREMFGKKSEKSLARSSISSVSQKEFYRQNYKPIYGIEIRGADGKLRFGSVLTAEDKAWLVADFNQVLLGVKNDADHGETDSQGGTLAPIKVGNRK